MPEENSLQLTDLLQQAQAARLANQLDQAAHLLGVAFEKYPEALPVAKELALLHQQRGEWPEARDCLELILAQEPHNSQAFNVLGQICHAQGGLPEALGHWQKAVEITPDYAEVWQNIALAHEHLDQQPEAIAAHQQVVRLLPDNSRAHRLLGMAQLDYGLLPAAHHCFERALTLAPDDPENKWQNFFIRALAGDFPQAWPLYECRFQLPGRTTPEHDFTQPRWQGEQLVGQTLLLHAEQGYGDTLQMIRYLPRVSERVEHLILWAPEPLVPLLQKMPGIDEVVSRKTDALSFEVHLPLMSLPGIFEDSLETIPKTVPYLGDPTPSAQPPRKVGLAWAGSGSQPLDRRSIPATDLAPLLEAPVEWHSLQWGQTAPGSLHDHSSELTDFAATAELIQTLDLVISVDTAVAHLAGALGKPVWILLSPAPDWRWGHEGSASPWYPTAQLHRRASGQTWPQLLKSLSHKLGLVQS